MGIQGLLPALRSLAVATHLRELRGQTCAVDVYAWIHRGTYGCATELCLDGTSDGYVSFCLAMLDVLLAHNITPIMVFDGARLVAKENVEKDREARRTTGMEEGKRLLAIGKSKEATNAFVRAVDVTPEMARKVVLAFRKRNVDVIVAPFEADAQLAYLSINNKVDFIVSEDSDCLAFGCRRVLFKLDRGGNGQLIDSRRLKLAEELYLEHFTPEMFLDMCILAGCDYLESVQGVGMKTAHQLVQKYKATERILRGLRFECKHQVIPSDYEKRFHRAKLTFRHQMVFCPDRKQFAHLTPLPENAKDVSPYSMFDDLSFLGRSAVEDAAEWALGNIHISTLVRFVDEPDSADVRQQPPGITRGGGQGKSYVRHNPAQQICASKALPKSATLDSYFAKKPASQTQPLRLGPPQQTLRPASVVATVSTTNPWIAKSSTRPTLTSTSVSRSRFFPTKLSSIPSSSSSTPFSTTLPLPSSRPIPVMGVLARITAPSTCSQYLTGDGMDAKEFTVVNTKVEENECSQLSQKFVEGTTVVPLKAISSPAEDQTTLVDVSQDVSTGGEDENHATANDCLPDSKDEPDLQAPTGKRPRLMIGLSANSAQRAGFARFAYRA